MRAATHAGWCRVSGGASLKKDACCEEVHVVVVPVVQT